MSTILNTLKKLEEEKSVLERSLNLKGLVLQTDRAGYPRQGNESENHARGLIALIAAGIVVGVGLGIYFNPTEKATTKSIAPAKQDQASGAKVSASEVPPALIAPVQTAPEQNQPVQAPSQAAQVQTVQKEVAVGIPLSSIQSTIKTVSSSPAVPAKINPVPSVVKTPPPSSAAKHLALTSKSAMSSPFEDTDDNRPESKIISMEVLPELYNTDPEIAGAKVNKLLPAHAKPKETGGHSGILIPGVKMKGIIYFSANNPSNYILITGPKDANQKLKIGDAFQDATLNEVHPDRAIFSYKGQLTQLRIGE